MPLPQHPEFAGTEISEEIRERFWQALKEEQAVADKRFLNKLWADLQTDDERIEFLRSGRAHATGIIAPCMVDEIITLLQSRKERDSTVVALANQADASDVSYRKAAAKTERVREELTVANRRIDELIDLVLAAMDDPPRQPKDAGNWEERARRVVG